MLPTLLSLFNISLVPCVFPLVISALSDTFPVLDKPAFEDSNGRLPEDENPFDKRRYPPWKPEERALAKTDLWPILRSTWVEKGKGGTSKTGERTREGTRRDADRFDNFRREAKVGFLELVGAIGLVGVLL